MKKKLNINLLKNNNLVVSYQNINYQEEDKLISYEIDNVTNSIYIGSKSLVFTRENAEFLFELTIAKDNNKCKYLLKELDNYLDVEVDDANYEQTKDKLIINYQIETDDEFTTVEIYFK